MARVIIMNKQYCNNLEYEMDTFIVHIVLKIMDILRLHSQIKYDIVETAMFNFVFLKIYYIFWRGVDTMPKNC